jgi:hypothetical protein
MAACACVVAETEDAHLREARQRFAGRDIYGYGGLRIDCGNWYVDYDPSTSVHVREVVRDTGRTEQLWTGTTTRWFNDDAVHFMAKAPLRFIVEKPAAGTMLTESNSGPPEKFCPAVVLADWQVDLTITTSPPPALPAIRGDYPALRKGMSRLEVAWRIGYPNGYDRLPALRHARTWEYNGGIFDSFTVTFANDRVASFTTPPQMP